MSTPQDLAGKIASLHSRIAKERKMLEGLQALRSATTNSDVIRTCEAKMRESNRTIGWFEQSLRECEDRFSSAGPPQGAPAASGPPPAGQHDPRMRSLPPPPGAPSNYQSASVGGATGAASPAAKPKPVYTSLDLIKADTPLTSAKISRMLHQLEFKLHVERQYKEGIDKMAKLYLIDGDKKARADTENKRVESSQKMQLLSQALKRYKTLDVMGDLADEDDGIPEDVITLRKPLSGALQITIKSARDLAHAPQPKKSKHPSETVVFVKVEDTPRARTHPTRSDRWNEDFEIHVDKANEVEVTIYDKVPGDSAPVPIGMLWLRLSDVVEELRRRKMGAEAGPGWVTAARVNSHQSGSAGSAGSGSAMDFPVSGLAPAGAVGDLAAGGAEGVDAWFAVEPEGAIFLHLNFVKSNVRKRPYDAGGLGRQGAVRKRKEEIHEQNGHKFVQKQFYAVVLCALCSEFLFKGAGMQCEDCKYACHKNCYQKVVTKCISKSNADSDKDDEKINHRIPHRFEPITNISPNWCCHCGMVLPLGRKSARKCSECGVTAHGDCAHLVPDFCGMSMEMANKLLSDIKTINSTRRPPAARPVKTLTTASSRMPPPDRVQTDQQPYAGARTPQGAYADLPGEVGRMKLVGEEQDQRYPAPLPTSNYPAQPLSQPQRPYPPQQRPQSQVGAAPRQPQQGPPRQGSSSSAASFGNDARDSIGSLIGGYGVDDRNSRIPPGGYRPPPQDDRSRMQVDQQYPQQQYPQQYAPPRPPQPPMNQPGQLFQPAAIGRPDPRLQQQQQQQHQQQQHPSAPSIGVTAPLSTRRHPAVRPKKTGLDDFNFLAVLGKGNFGKVMLAEEKKTSQLYAIKVLKKEFIIENDEVESTKSEKRVFLAAAKERHPFLLGLHSCFQTETRIYFVMEYVSGGDLMLHIQREQFTPRRAKFYAAEVLLALEYFHQNGIVYRDLKLDNILLTLDGHVKVADYGLCKEDMWFGKTTSTFCGTPEFMAPEIILEQRYGRAVDWWAFGVLIYEMLLGQSPFRGDDEDEIFDAILEDEPLYPIHMPKDSVSILTKLLTRDPLRRLGSGETDAVEIKTHAFFKDTNWDDIMNKRVPSPFFPTVTSATDTSNFDSEFTNEAPRLTPINTLLSAHDQSEFTGFSWTREDL